MPTEAELINMRDILLAHAIPENAFRRRLVVKFLFEKLLQEAKTLKSIRREDIEKACPPDKHSQISDPKATTRGLMRDIKKDIDAFFAKKTPEAKALTWTCPPN